MKLKHIRNRGCVPYLESEGVFLKPLVKKPCGVPCGEALDPFERVYLHNTLASARRFAFFKPHRDLIPKDQLDFVLGGGYDHSTSEFPPIYDCYLQNETLGKDTWRRLQNTKDLEPERDTKEYLKEQKEENERMKREKKAAFLPTHQRIIKERKPHGYNPPKMPYRYNFAHPVIISGLKQRRHPHNVKLMNSSHHLPQTNAGYSRQDSDGNVFQY